MKCGTCSTAFVRSDRVSRLPKGKHVAPPDSFIPLQALPDDPVPLELAMTPVEYFEWSSRETANSYEPNNTDS